MGIRIFRNFCPFDPVNNRTQNDSPDIRGKQFMSRKSIYLALSGLLMFVLLLTGLQTVPRSTYAAQPTATSDSDFPVAVETTGVIQSISRDQIVLADGSTFKIDDKTKLPKTTLQPGMTVTVEAELDSEELVAASISIGDGSDSS